jgi:sugar lactone lactonase YvrE
MVFDPASALLYIADTGNNRIAVLDTESGTTGASISPNYDKDMQNQVNGADLWTLIEGADVEMSAPSGIALHEGMLFVSDNDTSRILAFDLEDGELVDWVDTGLASGSIMGIDFDSDGSLWVVDAEASKIYRITEKP